ncbi:hypothetical protein MTO96_013851 [Rhipicephalus appendiculatus]
MQGVSEGRATTSEDTGLASIDNPDIDKKEQCVSEIRAAPSDDAGLASTEKPDIDRDKHESSIESSDLGNCPTGVRAQRQRKRKAAKRGSTSHEGMHSKGLDICDVSDTVERDSVGREVLQRCLVHLRFKRDTDQGGSQQGRCKGGGCSGHVRRFLSRWKASKESAGTLDLRRQDGRGGTKAVLTCARCAVVLSSAVVASDRNQRRPQRAPRYGCRFQSAPCGPRVAQEVSVLLRLRMPRHRTEVFVLTDETPVFAAVGTFMSAMQHRGDLSSLSASAVGGAAFWFRSSLCRHLYETARHMHGCCDGSQLPCCGRHAARGQEPPIGASPKGGSGRQVQPSVGGQRA